MQAGVAAFLIAATAVAQGPTFDVSSAPTLVIATGESEVLGTILLKASAVCGGNADGRCVSTPGSINVFYVGTQFENDVATGISVSETIGGVTTTAPTPGILITGVVTVENTPQGGSLSFAINGGVDLAAGGQLQINGVRGRIVSSPASVPGSPVMAQLSVSGSVNVFFSPSQVAVGRSAAGLQIVSLVAGPGPGGTLTLTIQEGFDTAFIQYVATSKTGPPANPHPSFGALNNTQLQFKVAGLAGRVQWPQTVPSQLAGGGGVAGGGSELQLISQSFDGSQAIYEFATADQSVSDLNVETFAVTVSVCGAGNFSIQAQLFPGLSGRPGFNDPLISPPGPDPVIRTSRCVPSPLAVVSGDNQIGVVGTPLPQPLVVRVQDANGNPVSGLTISFAAASAGGAILPAAANTDSQGVAQAIATLGLQEGIYTFTASANSLSVNFIARAVPTVVPPFPITNAVPHVVTGGGFLTKITVISLAGDANPIQVNFLSQGGQLLRTVTQTIPPNGRIDVSTSESDRFGELATQWAMVGSRLPVGVSVFIEGKPPSSAVAITAMDFSAADPVQTATLPFAFALAADGQSPALTAGLALANFSSNSNTVELKLVDQSGVVSADDSITLSPFGQTAIVLPDRPAFAATLAGREEFAGFLLVEASQPLLILEIGNDLDQFFNLPAFRPATCSPSLFSAPQTSIIPHALVGGGWATRITLTNPCPVQNTLKIEVFDQAGNPVGDFLNPSVSLGPLGTLVSSSSELDRLGALAVRWVRITSSVGFGVHVLLDYKATSAQVRANAVGFSQAQLLTRFTIPVDLARPSTAQSAGLTMGLALANFSNSTDNIVLQLVDSQGSTPIAETSLSLPPGAQTAFVLSDLAAFGAVLMSQGQFSGTLRVVSSELTAALAVGSDSGRSFVIPSFGLPSAH